MKKKKDIFIVAIFVILIFVGFTFLIMRKNNDSKKLDLNSVSYNYSVDDEMIMFLYDRYQSENQLKFQVVGSNLMDNDYYGFYYRDKKVTFKDFPDIYKSYILLDLVNYQDYKLDEERNCYLYPLDEFKDLYNKYYGNLDDFKIDTNQDFQPSFYLDENNICISNEEVISSDYKYALDTYMVNGVYQEDKIIIYERVAFIKLTDKKIEFYKDRNLKKKVYALNKKDVDISFLHNSKMVSNVLTSYQDDFPLYQYTYIKGDSTYYLESITK